MVSWVGFGFLRRWFFGGLGFLGRWFFGGLGFLGRWFFGGLGFLGGWFFGRVYPKKFFTFKTSNLNQNTTSPPPSFLPFPLKHPSHLKHPCPLKHPSHLKHPCPLKHPSHLKHPCPLKHPSHLKHPSQLKHPFPLKHPCPQTAAQKSICRKLELKDLLPKVMQRLTKYPLLIENLIKNNSRAWGLFWGILVVLWGFWEFLWVLWVF